MKAYLIDPIRKVVVPLEYDGTPQMLAEMYESYQCEDSTSTLTSPINNHGDYVTVNRSPARPLVAAYCWHYYCANCNTSHCFTGPGLITGSLKEDKDTLADPMLSLRAYKEMVQWGYIEDNTPAEYGVGEMPTTFVGTLDEFLEWLEGSDGKSVQ